MTLPSAFFQRCFFCLGASHVVENYFTIFKTQRKKLNYEKLHNNIL